MAKLAWIRAYSANAWPPSQAGSRISVRISSGSSAVVNGPCRNSAAGMVRVPAGPVATSSASSASATAGSSAAGSAWARLPPIVPLLRIGVCAMYPTASASRRGGHRHLGGALQLGQPGHRPDDQDVAVALDAAQAGYVAQVDEVARLGQPEVHQRYQALPAGEHPRLGLGVLGE